MAADTPPAQSSGRVRVGGKQYACPSPTPGGRPLVMLVAYYMPRDGIKPLWMGLNVR